MTLRTVSYFAVFYRTSQEISPNPCSSWRDSGNGNMYNFRAHCVHYDDFSTVQCGANLLEIHSLCDTKFSFLFRLFELYGRVSLWVCASRAPQGCLPTPPWGRPTVQFWETQIVTITSEGSWLPNRARRHLNASAYIKLLLSFLTQGRPPSINH